MKLIILYLLVPAMIISGCGHGHEHNSGDEHDENMEHTDHDTTIHSHQEEDAINAHDLEFGIIEIQKQTFSQIIHSSGQIMNLQGDEVTLNAMHDGLVIFDKNILLAGKEVNKNSQLITISGRELVHDNISSGYQESLNEYQKAKVNYERALELNKDKIISDREFQDLKTTFENANTNFNLIRKNYSEGGQKVIAPVNGYIKEVYVSEGEYVITGQPLFKISENKHLLIQADVPQEFFPIIKEIKTGNFKTPYDERIYKISDLNGKVISHGKTTGGNSLFIPLFFQVENKGNLISGSYLEVFLKGKELPGSIVIPRSAILEETGSYYVFIEGEDGFEKRYVKAEGFDGENYRVEGLSEGMHLATKNTYQIKLSQLSESLPQHSHSH